MNSSDQHITPKRLKAQALHYAILVCALVGIMLGAMVMAQAGNALTEAHMHMGHYTERAAHMGLLSELSEEPMSGQITSGRNIETESTRQNWGAYEVLIFQAQSPGHEASRAALIGSDDAHGRPALWLADKGDALALAGETRIIGTVHLPKRGVKRAYIAGKPFSGRKLVDGKVHNSDRGLPPLNPDALTAPNLNAWDSIQDISDLSAGDSINRSFAPPPMLWQENQAINLSGISLSGQIIISSKDSIYVAADTYLENVMLIAPVVHFASGFKGSAQVFATQACTVEENAILLYPSSILVHEERTEERAASVHVGENAMVIGAIVVTSGRPDFRNPVSVQLEKNCLVGGLVYSNGYVQHKGRVWGSIYTPEFRLKTAASSYTNHLLDAEIDATKLPEQVILPKIFKDDNEKGGARIISWLH